MGILREELKSKNEVYYSKFKNIEDISKKLMPKARTIFSYYTNHDFAHLENVEDNADKIVDKSVSILSDEEIFCLLCAIWLHDIGMIPFNSELSDFEDLNKEKRENLRNEIRERHNIRSKSFIDENKKELNLTDLEAKAIGDICKGHRNIKLSNLKNVTSESNIRTSSLAAILRLADECDISKNRESILSEGGLNEITKKEHFRIHKLVTNIIFDSDRGIIRPISHIYTQNDKEILKSKQAKIQKELKEVSSFLKKISINFNEVIFEYNIGSNLLKREVILCIAKNKDVFSIEDEYINQDDITDELERLTDKKILEGLSLTKDFEKFKEIYPIFLDEGLGEFFITPYVQEMILNNFGIIEDFFNVDWDKNDRKYRIKLLKNSPTSLYFLMNIDEIISNPKFGISANQNGPLMFDSLLSFGVFNDIYHYSNLINFDEIRDGFDNLSFFDKEYVLNMIMHCKLIGDM